MSKLSISKLLPKAIFFLAIILGIALLYGNCRMFMEELIFINLVFRAVVIVLPICLLLIIASILDGGIGFGDAAALLLMSVIISVILHGIFLLLLYGISFIDGVISFIKTFG